MRRVCGSTKLLLVCSVAIGLFAHGAHAVGAEIRWQAVAASSSVICLPGSGDCGETEIQLSSGGVTVTLFMEMSGWDELGGGHPGNEDYFLGAFQGAVDPTGYEGDVGCDLVPVGHPDMGFEGAFQALKVCTSAPYNCDPGVQDLLTSCTSASDCEAGKLCLDRCDFVYFQLDHTCTVSTATPRFNWSCASIDCREDPRDQTGFYGGTLVLEVPSCALGTYTINFRDDVDFTFFNSCPGPLMPGLTLTPAQITILPSRCCYGIGTDAPGCEDGISEAECLAKPRGRVPELGATCADPCAECLSDNRCNDPTSAQGPTADNLCTDDVCVCSDDTCFDGVCEFTPNYDVDTQCCDPDVGPQGGLTPIDDGDDGTVDICDPDTGGVTHQEKDCDGDGTWDANDNCPTVPNEDQNNVDGDDYGDACDGPFDADHDGDIDLFDIADFVACMSGPGTAATTECSDIHDFNGGLRVDLEDLALLQRVFTGSIVSPCD